MKATSRFLYGLKSIAIGICFHQMVLQYRKQTNHHLFMNCSDIGSLFFWAIFLIRDSFTEKDMIESVVVVVIIGRQLHSFSMD